MRLMSFALTSDQILEKTKTVTRRKGWAFAKVGDVVQPVLKGQGLKKGEKVTKLGYPVRLTAVSREVLDDITPQDVYREGFPQMTAREFVEMFKKHNGGLKDQIVTRIAFEYLPASSFVDRALTDISTSFIRGANG